MRCSMLLRGQDHAMISLKVFRCLLAVVALLAIHIRKSEISIIYENKLKNCYRRAILERRVVLNSLRDLVRYDVRVELNTKGNSSDGLSCIRDPKSKGTNAWGTSSICGTDQLVKPYP